MAVVQQYLPTTDPGAVGAANFLVEISAGNGGKISTKDFQKARQAALPYSRPTYMGLTAGGKVCSQCGTNRTPQWREGPEGPKTLCNACGVKRVRQMRLVSDGNKRRPPVPTVATKTAASLAKQSSGSFSSDNNAVMRRRDRSPSIRRPQRKAAAKAASRTAEFATTGDWPDDDGDATYSNPSAGQYTYTEPSNSEDSAALNSDSAEEVAWTPMRGPGPAHSSMPQPPSPFPAVGHETAAAVNLLSMSITQQDLGVGRNNGGSGPGPGFQQTHALEQQALQKSLASVNFNSASLASMAYAMMNADSSVEEHTSTDQAVEALQDALRSLPSKEHVNMLMLKEDLENSAREAAAADAAVAAVAKILAIKQAAAIRARATAASAAKKMHHWMNNLDEQYGWSSAIKKQRTL